MKVIKNENIIGVDIDGTLLLWIDPAVSGPGKLAIPFAGRTVYLTPHTYHVDLLKMYHERGCYLQFWSANGYRHAVRAIEALGLEYLADGENGHVQTKLCKHMDDNPNPASILGPRVFEEDLTKALPELPPGHRYPTPAEMPFFEVIVDDGGSSKPATKLDYRGVLNGR